MKRLITAFFLCFTLATASQASWPPAWLQQAVIRLVTDRVEASTPYHLNISQIRWTVWQGVELNNLRLTSKETDIVLLTASSLQIRLDGLALLHRQLRITHLRLVGPVLLIPLQDHEWALRSGGNAKAPPLSVDEIDIEDGKIILRPHHDDSAHEVLLTDCQWHARLSPSVFDIEHLDFKMGEGHASAHGDVSFYPAWKARLTLDTQRLPLDHLLRLFAPVGDLHLMHSGHTLITAGSYGMTFQTMGRLSDAPLNASGAWHAATSSYDARAAWSDVRMNRVWPGPLFKGAHLGGRLQAAGRGFYPDVRGEMLLSRAGIDGQPDQTVSARIQWVKGSGPVQLLARYGGLTAEATGQATLKNKSASGDFSMAVSSLNALGDSFAEMGGALETKGHFTVSPRGWSVDGQGSGHDGFWRGRTLKSMTWTFHDDPQSLAVYLSGSDFKWRAGEKNLWDLTTFNASVAGSISSWQVSLNPTFQNKAVVDTSGRLLKSEERWEFLTDHFHLNVPGGGTWQADQPIRLAWDGKKRAECRNFILVQGSQHVEFHDLLWSPSESLVDLSLHFDPSTFNGLQDAVEFSKGSALDALWKAQGQWPKLQSHGLLKGQADHLLIKTIGLTLKHWNCSIQSTDQVFDIQPCSAEMTKGSLSLTGHSELPALQASLRGTKVSVQYGKTFKGTGTIALDLSGTLQSPELRGHVSLSDAVYTAPPEKKKEPTPPASATPTSTATLWRHTLLDLTAQWPRDVWYRDGASSIETHADLRVQKAKGETDWRMSGTLTSVRGNYSYLGRSFNMDSAQLQFPDTPGFDPLLNVEASYPAEAVVVYLDISGSVHKPVIKLRSSPPMTDQDIISIIAFGQPVSELRSSGGVTTNQQMEAAAGSVLGSYVTDRLRNTGIAPLQFDVMNVQSTSQGSQLTIGRYLTRRLYISYGQTLSATAGKAFDADYFLTDRWILEAETGTTEGNYMDLLFRYPINGGKTDTTSNLLQSPFRNTLDLPTGINQPPLPSSSAP